MCAQIQEATIIKRAKADLRGHEDYYKHGIDVQGAKGADRYGTQCMQTMAGQAYSRDYED